MEQLLSHRAGLLGHRVLFARSLAKLGSNRSLIVAQAAHSISQQLRKSIAIESEYPPLYSDLGYLLVGVCLERLADLPLDAIVSAYVSRPLQLTIGSSRQWRIRDTRFPEFVAPSEYVTWRGGQIRGQVHDENAWALAGFGLAGHAGLFGTARDVAILGRTAIDALNGRDSPLRPFAVHYCLAPRPGGTLRAGFDGKSGESSAAGRLMGTTTFGHLGFTGTSLWCDPKLQITIALLTNRVCPSRANSRLIAARRSLHEELTQYILDRSLRA